MDDQRVATRQVRVVRNREGGRLASYECGTTPVGSARDRHSVKFYLGRGVTRPQPAGRSTIKMKMECQPCIRW